MDQTRAIKQFVIDEFLPDVSVDELDADYDLLAGGVIDSLGLLKVIAWLEDTYGMNTEDIELAPEHFHSVNAIGTLIAGRGVPAGQG